MKNFDIIVIGSGPGGYVAAIRAAHHGLSVALVEKDQRLGGTCLIRGCIPTKALLHSADVLESFQHAREHGIVAHEVRFDFGAVQKAREKAVSKSASGVDYLMRTNKVHVVHGHGQLADPHTVHVQTAQGWDALTGRHVILATGSVPRQLPSIHVEGRHIVTSDEILELKKVPPSLLILGAGAVGVEFASVYGRFGSKVQIVEMLDALLPIEDSEVSKEFTRLFKKKGITCHTQTTFEKAVMEDGQVAVTLESQGKVWTEKVDMLLVAIGRAPVTQNLGLEKVGIKTDAGGYIETDRFMRTSVASVYAIGDIVRTPWLAHVASAEGMLAADHAAGCKAEPINYLLTPSCTYAQPEVGSVGLTQRAAVEQGYQVKVGIFPFSAVPKARILGQTDGFVKIVADATYGEILGVHIIGPQATDMISEACLAMRLECTAEELARTMHAHPTLSEGMLEAAHATVGRAMHM